MQVHDIDRSFSQGSVPAKQSAGMMAKYFATSLAMENVVSAPVSSGAACRSPRSRSAWSGRCPGPPCWPLPWPPGCRRSWPGPRRPGPGRGVVGAVAHHGDQLAFRLFLANVGELGFRRRLGDKVVDAACFAMVAAVSGLSPVIMTVAGPSSAAGRSARSCWVSECPPARHAGDLGPSADDQRGGSLGGDAIDHFSEVLRHATLAALDKLDDCIRCALADVLPSGRSTPLMRVCAVNGTNSRFGGTLTLVLLSRLRLGATMLFPSGVSSAMDASAASRPTSAACV
jgi:hypothetical protein